MKNMRAPFPLHMILVLPLAAIQLYAAPVVRAAPVLIGDGAAVTVSLFAGQEQDYVVEVPACADSLQVDLIGMQGDLDLYTQYDREPVGTDYRCHPHLDTAQNESCVHHYPAEGSWFITVFACTEGSATLKVNVSIEDADPGSGVLANNDAVALSLYAGQEMDFRVVVPENTTALHVDLLGIEGDLDLYTRFSREPTASDYNCRPHFEADLNESCLHRNPSAGPWYISVFAHTQGTAALRVSYCGEGGFSAVTPLSCDEPAVIDLEAGRQKRFRIAVPVDTQVLTVSLTDMSGDLDLYTNPGHLADGTNYRCRPYFKPGSDEVCTHLDPVSGFWYITVDAQTEGNATLTATCSTVP